MAKEEKKIRYKSIDIDGVKYKTLLTNKYSKRKKYEDPNHALVRAFIPGTIAEFLIKGGNKVKEGDVVLTLDAMKMLNKVIAPMDGEVKYYVKENEVVTKNQVLFEVIV